MVLYESCIYVCSIKKAAQLMVLLNVLDWFISSIFKMVYLVKRHHIVRPWRQRWSFEGNCIMEIQINQCGSVQ